jgi:hypothetical protein
MKRATQAAVVLIVAVALASILTGVGSADPGSTATIHEVSTFIGNHQPPTGTFTATGLPACATGTSADQLVWFSPSGARLVVDRTYTCTDGGSFTVRLGLHLGVVDASGTQASDATWRIVSTADALTGLQGSGSAVGVGTGCSPVGAVFAECTGGTSVVTAAIH